MAGRKPHGKEMDRWSDLKNPNNNFDLDNWADCHNPNNKDYIGDGDKNQLPINQKTPKGGDKMSNTPPNGPSKTGNPSGPGRGNNPSKG